MADDDNIVQFAEFARRYREIFHRDPPSAMPKESYALTIAKETSRNVLEGYTSLQERVDATIAELDMKSLDRKSRHELTYFTEQLTTAVDYFTDVQVIVSESKTYGEPIKTATPPLWIAASTVEEALQHNVEQIIYGFADSTSKPRWAQAEMFGSMIDIQRPVHAYKSMAEDFDPNHPNTKPKYLKVKRACQQLAYQLTIPVISFGIGALRAATTEEMQLEDFALTVGIPLGLKVAEYLHKHGLTASRLNVDNDAMPVLLGMATYLAGNLIVHSIKNSSLN